MNEEPYKNIVVVCGPTASGKTRLGVRIALRFGGEIVSCDSRQVYRGMDIGTGKDLSEYRIGSEAIPYHLIDTADPSEVYSVYRYQRDFYRIFEELLARQRLPVVVGGTGLYLEAVLRAYRLPEAPGNPELRTNLMREDKQSLDRRLATVDSELYASTDRTSKKRIARSLEVALSGGARTYRGERNPAAPRLDPVVLCVTWERHRLHERIKRRLDERFDHGMVEEVRHLLDAGIPRERFAMFGMEYKHIGRYLYGEVGFEDMKTGLFRDICKFAKRQESYFRGMERRGIKIHWIREDGEEEAMAALAGYRFGRMDDRPFAPNAVI